MPTDETEVFHGLNPDAILAAIESTGMRCNGRFLELNSYENRVYQIGIEDERPIVAKFYRPQRWSDEAIVEEHQFVSELEDAEVPVVAPLNIDGQTLLRYDSFRFSLYLSQGGRAPEIDNEQHLLQLGRLMARVHAIGSVTAFQHRPTLSIDRLAREPIAYLLESNWIPPALETAYVSLTDDLLQHLEQSFSMVQARQLRLHGDCHIGNILWNNDTGNLVDFDDTCTGPAIQDLWMLLSGDRDYMAKRFDNLLKGYVEFYDFDPRELALIEPLRTLRIIHYAAWLARRWDDPAFPKAFTWFNEARFWDDHILSLREQAALLTEPPIELL